MTQQEPSDDSGPTDRSDPLLECALNCRNAYRAWQVALAANDEQRAAALADDYRYRLDELWQLLKADLLKIARVWRRSNVTNDLDSLAMNLFAQVVFELPQLTINPSKNVRNLFKTIAHRGMIDEYRKVYTDGPRRAPKPSQEVAEAPEIRMWPAVSTNPSWSPSLDQQTEIADPQSLQIEETLTNELDQRAILQELWDYWRRELPPLDLRIVELRWLADPPGAFREIAAAIGPGWEEAAVRQRHHRIMADARRHLRELGLIDDHTAR